MSTENIYAGCNESRKRRHEDGDETGGSGKRQHFEHFGHYDLYHNPHNNMYYPNNAQMMPPNQHDYPHLNQMPNPYHPPQHTEYAFAPNTSTDESGYVSVNAGDVSPTSSFHTQRTSLVHNTSADESGYVSMNAGDVSQTPSFHTQTSPITHNTAKDDSGYISNGASDLNQASSYVPQASSLTQNMSTAEPGYVSMNAVDVGHTSSFHPQTSSIAQNTPTDGSGYMHMNPVDVNQTSSFHAQTSSQNTPTDASAYMPINTGAINQTSSFHAQNTSADRSGYVPMNAGNMPQQPYPGGLFIPQTHRTTIEAEKIADPNEDLLGEKIHGRLSLNAVTNYNVSVAEIHRRMRLPELLNSSSIACYLRVAKTKECGEKMRETLRQKGIEMQMGKRKNGKTTTFTALVEEEAVQVAFDLDKIAKESLPIDAIAQDMVNLCISQGGNIEQLRQDANNARLFFDCIAEVSREVLPPLTGFKTRFCNNEQFNEEMSSFSLQTHGFGIFNQRSWIDIFDTIAARFS